MHHLVKVLPFIALFLMVAYGLVCAYAFVIQRKIQYQATHRDQSGQGDSIFEAWRNEEKELLGYVRNTSDARAIALFFHGNGGEALDRTWVDELLPSRSLPIYLIEYPGYGGRGGAANERSLYHCALEAYDQVRTKHPDVPVIAIGESLGCGPASYLASRRPVAKLGLISPFPSIVEIARKSFPYLPVQLLLRDRYPIISHIRSVESPLFIVHGSQDEIIPVELGDRVYQSAGSKEKRMIRLPGYGHNNLVDALIHSPFAQPFRDFLS